MYSWTSKCKALHSPKRQWCYQVWIIYFEDQLQTRNKKENSSTINRQQVILDSSFEINTYNLDKASDGIHYQYVIILGRLLYLCRV